MKADPKMNLLVSGTDDQEPRCDFCVQTAASNRNGQPEELLICRDCQAKGTVSFKNILLLISSNRSFVLDVNSICW